MNATTNQRSIKHLDRTIALSLTFALASACGAAPEGFEAEEQRPVTGEQVSSASLRISQPAQPRPSQPVHPTPPIVVRPGSPSPVPGPSCPAGQVNDAACFSNGCRPATSAEGPVAGAASVRDVLYGAGFIIPDPRAPSVPEYTVYNSFRQSCYNGHCAAKVTVNFQAQSPVGLSTCYAVWASPRHGFQVVPTSVVACGGAQICNDWVHQDDGFLNEEVAPGHWELQAVCIESNGQAITKLLKSLDFDGVTQHNVAGDVCL